MKTSESHSLNGVPSCRHPASRLEPSARAALRAAGALALALLLPAASPAADFVRGDANASATRDITDGIFIFNFLFLGASGPTCADAADADDSGDHNLTDGIYLLNFLFLGGPEPPPPHLGCGADPTGDTLGCDSHAACASGGPGSVEESLAAAGLPRTPSPRVDEEGQPLPPEYSPLGERYAVDAKQEFLLVGLSLAASAQPDTMIGIANTIADPEGYVAISEPLLYDPRTSAVESWHREVHAAAAGDLDGDGLDELAVVSREGPFNAGGFNRDVAFRILDQAAVTDGTVAPPLALLRVPDPRPSDIIAAAAGRLEERSDAPGAEQVAVFVYSASLDPRARLHIVSGQEVRNVPVPQVEEFASTADLAFADVDCGNLDGDAADEIALLLKPAELDEAPLLVVLDDAADGHRELGRVEIESGCEAGFGGNQLPVAAAGIAVANLDGDSMDEIAVGWMMTNPELVGFPSPAVAVERVTIIDDAGHGLAARRLPAAAGEDDCPDPFGEEGYSPLPELYLRRPLHVSTPDLDGDGSREIWAHGRIWTASTGELRHRDVLEDFSIEVDERFLLAAAADLTGDGRDTLVAYANHGVGGGDLFFIAETADVFGLELGIVGGWDAVTIVDCCSEAYLIVPANIDDARFEFKGSRQVFTQPIINAVLAAPPCQARVGQNTDECTTSYGRATAVGGGTEDEVTFTVGFHIGLSGTLESFGQEVGSATIKRTVETTLSASVASAYELTKSVTWTTDPGVDAVVVTSVPFDQYLYEVVSHTNPAMVGEVMVVSLPRTPSTTILERGFYHERVAREQDVQIDASILGHTIGDVATYPSESEMLALIAEKRGMRGIRSQSATAGQGGTTEVAIALTRETTTAAGFAVDTTVEVETTVTIGAIPEFLTISAMAGFSIGMGAGRTFTYTTGESTEYVGRVGSIPSGDFGYGFGLFTYIHEDAATGQEFEVLNYWVRP